MAALGGAAAPSEPGLVGRGRIRAGTAPGHPERYSIALNCADFDRRNHNHAKPGNNTVAQVFTGFADCFIVLGNAEQMASNNNTYKF